MNKTIHMTYKKQVPQKVFDRWTDLNPDYKTVLSLDNDCVQFLKNNFNDYVADLFTQIKEGMYKADLWRLCKLYVEGGVYADVDLVPYVDIDNIIKNEKISFCSSIGADNQTIFQAFMITTKEKSPLILHFIVSFLMSDPYRRLNGPCYDMYNCISYNLNSQLSPDKKYHLEEVRIKVKIGSSETNTKEIDLFYFPNDVQYDIKLLKNKHNDAFEFKIKDNILIVKRTDNNTGWEHSHSCEILIPCNETIYLFKENLGPRGDLDAHVLYKNKKIMNSRDPDYFKNSKSW